MVKLDIQGGNLEDFNRIININGVVKEFSHTRNSQDIIYRYCGIIVAQKVRFFKRGKEYLQSIFIPNRDFKGEL